MQFLLKKLIFELLQLYFPGFGWFPYSPDRFHSYISSLNSICNCTYTELHRHICVSAQIGLCRCKQAGVTPKAHSACKAHNLICSRRWWSCINPTTHPLAFCVQSGKFKMADWENSPRLIGPHWGHTLGWQSTDTFTVQDRIVAYPQEVIWTILKDTEAPQGSSLRFWKTFTFGIHFSLNYSQDLSDDLCKS